MEPEYATLNYGRVIPGCFVQTNDSEQSVANRRDPNPFDYYPNWMIEFRTVEVPAGDFYRGHEHALQRFHRFLQARTTQIAQEPRSIRNLERTLSLPLMVGIKLSLAQRIQDHARIKAHFESVNRNHCPRDIYLRRLGPYGEMLGFEMSAANALLGAFRGLNHDDGFEALQGDDRLLVGHFIATLIEFDPYEIFPELRP